MGSEQLNKRLRNQHQILRELHFHGPLRRGELSDRLSIRKSSTTSIITGLLELELIVETVPGHMRSPLRLEDDRFHVIAAELFTDRLTIARVFLDGKVVPLVSDPIAPETPPAAILERVAHHLANARASHPNDVLGLGLAIPGLVNPGPGFCFRSHPFGWENVAVGDILTEHLDVRVLVENDTRCQLWCAYWFDRLASESNNIVYINLDDGVACSIISDGRQITGERFAAGEIGHIEVGTEGRPWPSGRTDCLEAYCSIPALLADAVEPDTPNAPTTALALSDWIADHPETLERLDTGMRLLARTAAGLVAAIDPELIVLGTPSESLSAHLQPLLQKHLFAELIGRPPGGTSIRIAGPVRETTLKGIGALVIDNALLQAHVLRDTRHSGNV